MDVEDFKNVMDSVIGCKTDAIKTDLVWQLHKQCVESREKAFIFSGLVMTAHKHTSIYPLALTFAPHSLQPKLPVDCTVLQDGSVESKRVMRYENETKREPQTYQAPLIRSLVQRQLV